MKLMIMFGELFHARHEENITFNIYFKKAFDFINCKSLLNVLQVKS